MAPAALNSAILARQLSKAADQIAARFLNRSNSELTRTPSKILDLASAALIAEYNAMRAASLSRDQMFSSLQNFAMILFSATVAAIPAVISNKYFVILPLCSLLLTVIASTYMHQKMMLNDLANYERDELRPRLQRLLALSCDPDPVPPDVPPLWGWQIYFPEQRSSAGWLGRTFGRFTTLGFGPLITLAPVGYLVLFVYYRGIRSVTPPEGVLFWMATLSILFLLMQLLAATLHRDLRNRFLL